MECERDFIRFLHWTGAMVALGALLAVMLVLVVDPYRIYHLVDWPGFNHIKPAPERYQEEIKLSAARALHANLIMLGNSRAEIGFNPDTRYFAAHGYSAYNLAISGSGIATARRQFDYIRSAGEKPAVVLLGLEFIDFLLDPALAPAPYRAPQTRHAVDGWEWQFDAIFSLNSASDAIKTLLIQRRPEAETVTARGFNPLLEYRKFAREGGYYSIFQQRAAENARSYVRKPRGVISPLTGSSQEWQELRGIFAALPPDKTEVALIIYPYHAQILAMFEQIGLWPAFDEWKSLLAREVDAARAAHPNANITLWDFSGFSPYQCETIPARGDTASHTRWYWEAGHFKPALGELMLTRMLERPSAPDKLGFPLTSSRLPENRRRIAAERAACAAAYPQLFSDVATLLAAARERGAAP
ncbi:hypothetical protein AAKU55_001860 [Oxalobacteraceae bacterium GrIS 1.11]